MAGLGMNDAARIAAALSAEGEGESPRRTATVARTDRDGTIWVRLAGADSETPVERSSVTVKDGETVEVIVSNGRAIITGNVSNPSAQIGYADEINTSALRALQDASAAGAAAASAQESAETAATAAASAQESATQALADAASAAGAASRAQSSADNAATAAGQAQSSAAQANQAANNALTQLSTVQDVVGVVEWAASHSEQDMADYINSHLSLTTYGLDLVLDNTGYRIHIGTLTAGGEDGVYIIDGSGDVVTTFGENIDFSSSRPQYIGGEDAYIVFVDTDSDGIPDTIRIGGNIIMGGNKTLSEILSDVAEAKQTAQAAKATATSYFTDTTNGVIVHRAGEDGSTGWTGWRIQDLLEMLVNGQSLIQAGLVGGRPSIRVGPESGGMHLNVTSDRLAFCDAGGAEVAYIAVDAGNNSKLYISEAVVMSELNFGEGKWTWRKRENDNLSLKWTGA